jgi:hypothetical protein
MVFVLGYKEKLTVDESINREYRRIAAQLMLGTLVMRIMRMFTRSQTKENAKTRKMRSVVVGMKYRKEADVKYFNVIANKLPVKAKLVREPRNKHDANAIMVVCNGRHIGYIPKCQSGKIHAKFKIINAVQVSANERSPECPFVDITYQSQ